MRDAVGNRCLFVFYRMAASAALIAEYGEEEAQDILGQIYDNAGPHVEDSGSAR